MAGRRDIHTPYVLANKPSSSFSTVSSAASATSAATSRSGGSKLLFGEIDLSSDRSSESYASVCSFVLCESATFLKFWLEDKCRDTLLSYIPKDELKNVRLVSHDCSVRAGPALFSDLSITFKTGIFTKPARLAALDRLGFYVKTVRFSVPHTADTFLPPLVEPDTGEELSFSYTPQLQAPSVARPKYGDIDTTEILTRQWPTLFHAATNVPAFVRAFSAFINLQHLQISCPGYDPSTAYRRSIVDFALISLRIATEQNCLNTLDTLTLSPIHPSALSYLSSQMGYGASPRSARVWSRIQHLNIAMISPPDADTFSDSAHFKLLQAYLRTFQANLTTFDFRWLGGKGPLPVKPAVMYDTETQEHPATRTTCPPSGLKAPKRAKTAALHFPVLRRLEIENVASSAKQIRSLVGDHSSTIEELDLEDVDLVTGTWDEALAPLTSKARPCTSFADIPIMLSPSTASPTTPIWPAAMERIDISASSNDRPSMRVSKWLPSRKSKPVAARKVREGLQGCEEQLRKVFGGVLSWR